VCDLLGEVTADTICEIDSEKLQKCGLTFRKVNYIKDLAKKVQNSEFNIEALWEKSDEDVIAELTSLKGIGVWTAEMLMIFCMQRQNILSFGDLAIHRGMRMLYHHRNIDRQLFLKYRRRYSPYCTVASLYIWKVAGGAIEGMKDYAPKKKR
jgi:DNA-3-methyladenine glycosylase II